MSRRVLFALLAAAPFAACASAPSVPSQRFVDEVGGAAPGSQGARSEGYWPYPNDEQRREAGRPAREFVDESLTRDTSYPTTLDMTTWSVVGVDPKTGDVGVAVASCVPSFGDAVAALVPGKGAAATQAGFDIKNRNKVFEALKQGLTAEQVIAQVTDPAWDKDTDRRQYGVVTMHSGFVRTAGFTTPVRQGLLPGENGAVPRYAGVMADAGRGVSAQGNTLAGPEVVQWPLDMYRWEDPTGFNSLADRLMRALEAGSRAGGDVRCNDGNVRQTTSMAAILVARGSDPPYATENIGMTDAGTSKAPWLNLSVKVERGGENPLLEMRRQYDKWRRTVPK